VSMCEQVACDLSHDCDDIIEVKKTHEHALFPVLRQSQVHIRVWPAWMRGLLLIGG
jgi:hypothetical protein